MKEIRNYSLLKDILLTIKVNRTMKIWLYFDTTLSVFLNFEIKIK